MKDYHLEKQDGAATTKKKRSRRRRKPRSGKNKVEPIDKAGIKKQHDAPMTKRDLYFTLNSELVTIGHGCSVVARVTMLNWDAEVVLDTFVQVPVPVSDFRGTGITAHHLSSSNPQAMSFAKVRQSVHQILRGKILVGYNLQEHLTSLGLTHPSTDVRDSSDFKPFQYEEIDGVTDERVVVQRRLEDLAGEFLQREISEPLSPMESCVVAIDLYKAFRRNWEEYLAHQAQEKENRRRTFSSSSTASSPSSHPLGQRARAPSYDNSLSSCNGTFVPAAPDRNPAWYSMEQPSQPELTSQVLKMLDCEDVRATLSSGGPSLYGSSSTLYGTSSSYESSAYYEGSSMVSDSYVTESIASSLQEEAHQIYQEPSSQSSSSSWFRFGSRKSRQAAPAQAEHMASLIEELDDAPVWPSETTAMVGDACEVALSEEHAVVDEAKQGSSWFSFRRPKSPKPGRKLYDSDDERASTPVKSRGGAGPLRRRGSMGSSGRLDSLGSSGRARPNNGENIVEYPESSEVEKQTGSWFSFRRSTKSTTQMKRHNSQEQLKEPPRQLIDQPPNPDTEHTDTTEEDWLREVVGSPNTQKKDVLATSWLKSEATRFDLPLVPGPPQSQKEPPWLPRFMRQKTASSEAATQEETMVISAGEDWVGDASEDQNGILSPSFFSQVEPIGSVPIDSVASSPVALPGKEARTKDIFISRERLETDATIPMIPSEVDDENSGSSEEIQNDLVQGMEQHFSFLNI